MTRRERRQRALREAERRAEESLHRESKAGRQFARMGEPAMNDEYVELEDCYIGHVTELAVQVHHDGEVFWVPKSVIADHEEIERYDEHITVYVKEWFARKEGLI